MLASRYQRARKNCDHGSRAISTLMLSSNQKLLAAISCRRRMAASSVIGASNHEVTAALGRQFRVAAGAVEGDGEDKAPFSMELSF